MNRPPDVEIQYQPTTAQTRKMLPTDAIAKHWVLHLVNCPVPLHLVYPAVKTEALNAKEIPGFGADDYAAVLKDLLGERTIQFSDRIGASTADLADTLQLLRQLPVAPSWETSRMPGDQVRFELTSRGGAVWETRC